MVLFITEDLCVKQMNISINDNDKTFVYSEANYTFTP